ncbi:MAG: amino acid permease [Candidatus Cloacimonetes bacterium]|nr:amino acid permease [Candidatus Cloacimonadota bacterium]
MNLKKQISTFDIFCIASGVMISSGIFILPGIAFSKAGPAVFLSYAIAGIAALLGILSVIELSTAMPRAGGDYFFITRSFGPVPGMILGFFSWFALSLKTAFAIFGIGKILHSHLGISLIATAIIAAIFFTALNIKGINLAVKFEVIIVTGLLLIMITYVVSGIPGINLSRFMDFTPHGIKPVFLTAGFVFVSYGGLLKIASLSGEVKNPGKSIPRGVIISTLVVTTLYVLLLIVVIGTMDPEKLVSSLTPVADSAVFFLGNTGFLLISIAALLAFVSTANAGIMSASRYPVALSQDSLLPSIFGKISKRFNTPILSIILTGSLIVGSLFLELETLVKIASSIILFSYILTNIAVIIIRESRIQNYRPTFKVPLYPFVQIISIILFSFLLIDVGIAAMEAVIGIIVTCLLIYLLYGRRNYSSEYALLYLVERIINKKLVSNDLEQELKEILQHRDNLVTDKFHHLIEESIFLDLDGKLTRSELFNQIADTCCSNLQMEPPELLNYLEEREQESSTALTPFLAIPHIIVEGTNIFQMFVIRVKDGVYFSDEFSSIKAIFALIGSRDQRQFHLQALSSIAQITHNKDFEKLWLKAKTSRNLKDICLLSDRNRQIKVD